MLAFAHIPTGPTASKELDIDEVKGRSLAAAATEPTSKSAGLHFNKRFRLSHDRGPPHFTRNQHADNKSK
jgi:hypothetical protein